jgi:hypothetical protein
MGQAWHDKQAVCPITGKPIIIDPAALAGEGPIIFRCPVCDRQHRFHALDASVVELEVLESDEDGADDGRQAETP